MREQAEAAPYDIVWNVALASFWRRSNFLKIVYWRLVPSSSDHFHGVFFHLFRRYELFRVSRATTRVLGHRYRRSRTSIEVDLTYACNLRCVDCNRSVTQAPSNERMSAEQIAAFLMESRTKSYHWKIIRLLGGEPTLHPKFHEIIDLMMDHKRTYEPELQIIVVTNGVGDAVQAALAKLPDAIIIENTHKTGDPAEDAKAAKFAPFNKAPRDQDAHAASDFSNGCSIVEMCGMGLTPYGFYPCAVAGGIDRIIGLDAGRKALPDKDDEMRDQLSAFCSYCGHFCADSGSDGQRVSRTWTEKYAAWRQNRPGLTRYSDARPGKPQSKSEGVGVR